MVSNMTEKTLNCSESGIGHSEFGARTQFLCLNLYTHYVHATPPPARRADMPRHHRIKNTLYN